jgi:MFS family permease
VTAEDQVHRPGAPPTTSPALVSLCAAVTVSELGDWLMFIALPLVVLRSSGSAFATSAVFLAELVPAVVIGTVGGPVIDRHDPGRLLAALTAAQALVLLPLLWAGPGSIWLVYVVAAIQAAFTSLTTPTQQAIVPRLFPPSDVARVNGLVITAENVARLAGSPLGGVLLPIIGLHGLVLADTASFVLSGILLLPLLTATRTGTPTRNAEQVPPVKAIMSGARAVRRNRTLRGALMISFLAAVAQGLFLVLFVLFVVRSLHGGDGLVGLLRGVQAVGGVLGGVLIAVSFREASARTLTAGGLAAFASISALAWNSPHLTTAAWWYVVLFIAVGIPATLLSTGLTTATQQASSHELRGRTLSLLSVAQATGQATGILAAGLLSSTLALGILLNAQAICYAVCALIAATTFTATSFRLNVNRGSPAS